MRDAVSRSAQPAAHGRERLCVRGVAAGRCERAVAGAAGAAGFRRHADAALKHVAVIEAANAEEEALAIAIALARSDWRHPDKTAALVTPDRALARRVLAALERWNVPVDDSGGDALADTPPGVFARLVAEAALDGLPPVTLLALLKHPSCGLDRRRGRGAGARDAARAAAETGHGGAGAGARRRSATSWQNSAQRAVSLHRSDPRRRSPMLELAAAGALVDAAEDGARAAGSTADERPTTFATHRGVPRARRSQNARHR